jgi:hypothetical protein
MVNMKIAVFWDVTSYSLMGRYQLLEKTAASIFRAEEYSTRKTRVRVPPKCAYLTTNLRCGISRRIVIFGTLLFADFCMDITLVL